MSMSKELPIIFILDMDNTIIGNSIFLRKYSNLINYYILKNCENKKISGNICNINKDLWKQNISPYYIRPYFKEFIFNLKKIYNNIEFFIFSYGKKKYVEETIEYIEENINFKFNRPLFTREDSLITIDNNYIKEIDGFKEIIQKSLESKYSLLEIDDILKNRLIIIDDVKDFWKNSQLIICDEYIYTPIPYLDYSFLNEIRINENILNYIKNSNNNLFPFYNSPYISIDDFFLNYHLYTSELLRKNLQKNNEAIKDDFFKQLLIKLKPRLKLKKPFTSKFIASLNKKMIK